MMRERLQHDFQFAVVVMCGGLAVLALLPFAVYRFVQGQYAIALMDLGIIVVIVGASLQAWRSGDATRAGLLICAIGSLGLIALAISNGAFGMLWAYPVLLVNFFIAPRAVALTAALSIIGGLLLGGTFVDGLHAMTFAVTGLLLTLFATIIAQRAQAQRERLERMASHDTLTGAGNRRLLEIELDEVTRQAHAGRAGHGLALLDLDRFKSVNDEHGHGAGDAVLRDMARIVVRSTRKFDRFYRLGGEEFVLLLQVVDAAALEAALRKVHARLREELRGPGGPVTVSIGAAMPEPGESWQHWLARADAALYRAKRGGRDRLEFAGAGEGPFERRRSFD